MADLDKPTSERIRRRVLDFVRVIYSTCLIPGILFLSLCAIRIITHVLVAKHLGGRYTGQRDLRSRMRAISISIHCYPTSVSRR